ncbi:MAG: Na+/H+ antiporter NhaA [Actinomycetales bacterium]|nr:Na+/H+ antiporter NhaA [Actinomycetales bacterium]
MSRSGGDEPRLVFERLPLAERSRLLEALREETVGGALLLGAAVLALAWANSPWRGSYHSLAALEVGPESLHLHLSLATWAADGLLAVFFFVAGLELKHELVVGTLSRASQAVVPIVAALSGMVVPALLYVGTVHALGDADAAVGWGIPMATDIAFALAVLAVMGAKLPVALRAFLLTLAVVDDLGAILVIAVFYGHGFSPVPFALAIAGLAAYWVLQRLRVDSWLVLVPLALVVWGLMHASGVHATVAGVALGLLTRVRPDPGEAHAPVDRFEHAVRPLSAGVCVPLFAFFSAGVTFIGLGGSAVTEPVAVAVVVGLVVGKPLGVYGGARIVARFTRASLSSSLRWADVLAVGILGGIGFTVSLLIDELAFTDDPGRTTAAKIGVLLASVLAALLASVALTIRRRAYAALAEVEERDDDGDGVPDVYGSDANSPGSR